MSKFCLLLVVLLWASTCAEAQFRRLTRKQAEFAFSAETWLEGYAETLSGKEYRGPAVTRDTLDGIAAFSGGENAAIVWRTSPAPDPLPRRYVYFLAEGALDITNRKRTFRVAIDDVPRFTFNSSAKKDWKVKGKEGSELSFHHFTVDRNRDVAGYFLFRLPVDWLTPGEPVEVRIEGEGSKGVVWLTIFENPQAVYHLARRARIESWMEVTLTDEGKYQTLEVFGPPDMSRSMISFEIGNALQGRKQAILREGRMYASFRVRNSRRNTDGMSLKILVDEKPFFNFPAIYRKRTVTEEQGNSIITMEGGMYVGSRWKLEVTREYRPD